MKDRYIYPAIFDYSDDGISIEFPDLPGCLSCADTDEEALYMAKEVLRLWIQSMEDNREKTPKPTNNKNISLEDNQKIVLIEI